MDSTKIPGNEFLDILFDGRNKDYGAYELRSRYDKRVRNAIAGTASVVLVMIGGYVLNNRLMAAENVHRPVFVEKVIQLDDVKVPEPDPVIPPPPPVTQSAPPPVAATVAFVKPEIVSGEVPPEEAPPKMSEIGNKAIGFENTDGAEDGVAAELSKGRGNGVVQVEAPPAADHAGPLTFVEMMPEFPGGEAALNKYLNKNIRYPHMAQESDIQGTVFIQFVVNRDGSITDVKTVGAAKGGGLEEEAKRVVSNMPKWKAGRQNGQNVAVFFNLPIRFVLGQ